MLEKAAEYRTILIAVGGGLAGILLVIGVARMVISHGNVRVQQALSKAETTFSAPLVSKEDLEKNPQIKQYYEKYFHDPADRDQEALTEFEQVIGDHGSSTPGKLARYYAAVTMHRMHRYDEAKDAYAAFLDEADPDSPLAALAWQGLGYCEEENGRLDDAAEAYQKASRIESAPAVKTEAYLNLARVYESRKDYAQAIENLNAYLISAPEGVEKSALERRLEQLKSMAGT
ncbi:MAG: tetratricopeptide repeat protein [Deltaproteobacteria bacterium]|nr:tetratricopeptide repeat protein [Deltaproteobacteria bacterium]